MATIDIPQKTFEQIKQYPLFFFNTIIEWNYKAQEYDYYWIPESVYGFDNRNYRISYKEIQSHSGNILLAFGIPYKEYHAETSCYIRPDYTKLRLETFDSNNIEHVSAVLNLFLTKAHNTTDSYAAREFLWMLNSYHIEIPTLSNALNAFDLQTVQPFFLNSLQQLSKCLSLPKQQLIQNFLASKGITYNIYFPLSLKEALNQCCPNIDFSKENKSIFELVRIAVSYDKYDDSELDINIDQIDNPTNFFIQIRKWLNSSNYKFSNYETLCNFFRLFPPAIQLLLVKRYFHAIRCGHTEFNQNILKHFQINKFENWGTYYHCAHEASNPIQLAVPLLCDNILTFINSNHTALQSINGTLDMAYARCDTNSPAVDFGLKHIVPVCDGGAILNKNNFPGFICYKTIFTLNEQAFAQDSVTNIYRQYLKIFGQQQSVFICNEKYTPFQKCQKRIVDSHACETCDSRDKHLLDEFVLKLGGEYNNSKRTILQLFTDIDFSQGEDVLVKPTQSIISSDEVKERVISWLNKNLVQVSGKNSILKTGKTVQLHDGWMLKKGIDTNYNSLFKNFIKPSWCTVEPRRNAYIGESVLNKRILVDEGYIRNYKVNCLNDTSIQEQENRKENELVMPRVIAALNERLDVLPDNKGIYHIVYDVELMRQLKADFYTFTEQDNSTIFEKNTSFLTRAQTKYDKYCAPKYEGNINFVTQLPYVWCRGKECFKPCLGDQTLASCKSWEKYTILHMLEILGFPQVKQTEGGNEASELIRNFIGMVNKANSLFKRVICRECHHILFPIGTSMFNRYNNFECRFPTCKEHYKRIYLSQCHHCKSGLIDSRDSAQCPNGWYICPNCLSCCDDIVYDKMSSKYVARGLPIPSRIKEKIGHGHNNNGEYFCPKCGGKIITKYDEHSGCDVTICQNCKTRYDLESILKDNRKH